MKSEVEQVILDRLILGLERTYYRFESTFWYKYDQNQDALLRVLDSAYLEEEYNKAKNNS